MKKKKINNDTTEINSNKFINKHKLYMNNYYKSVNYDKEFIINNIYTSDSILINKIYEKITSPYQKKINLIYSLLNLDINLNFNTVSDIKKFFNWISPLNIEYELGSPIWNIKTIQYGNKHKILFQNSISKKDINESFYKNYISLIKKKLNKSKLEYYYFEFKSKRFNKIKDIIFVISI